MNLEPLLSSHLVVDVRTPLEYAEDHIPGAINVPLLGGPARVRDVLNRLEAAGLEAHNIDLHAPTLDDVFLALTRTAR